MEDKKYCVYMHKNKTNGKVYIGITSMPPNNRWRKGVGYKGQKFERAIKKYGWDGFEHIILFDNLKREDACNKEIELIEFYKSRDDNFGYNVSFGGEYFGKISEEDLIKRSERTSGGKNPMARKVFYDGKVYETLKDFCIDNNVDSKSAHLWMRGLQGCPVEFIEKGLRFLDSESQLRERKFDGTPKKVICNNHLFDSVEECAKFYQIKPATMSKWLNKTNPIPESFYVVGLKYLDGEINENISTNCVYCGGIIYDSQKDFAEKNNLNSNKVGIWLKNPDKMPEEFKKLGLKKCSYPIEWYSNNCQQYRLGVNAKPITCIELDIKFNSITECVEYFKNNLNIIMKITGVSRVLNNKRKQYMGYTFEYL